MCPQGTIGVRYRFRGLKRDTGKAVEGHVEAPTEDTAYEVLSDHGIVTESLRPDPRPRTNESATAASARSSATATTPTADGTSASGDGDMAKQAWDIADAIESAFDTSAQQVAVDKLAQRFRGQRVWVIDREKIRRRVMQVVEQAVAQGTARHETHEQVRDRIASAMEEMFQDNRNLTSQAQQPQQGNEALERQIDRLSRVVEGMERAVGNLTHALRSGIPAGGPARFGHEQRQRTEEQDAALLEIFESNLELRREVDAIEGNGEASGGGDGESKTPPD